MVNRPLLPFLNNFEKTIVVATSGVQVPEFFECPIIANPIVPVNSYLFYMKHILIGILGISAASLLIFVLWQVSSGTMSDQTDVEQAELIPDNGQSILDTGQQVVTPFTPAALSEFQVTTAGQYGWQPVMQSGSSIPLQVALASVEARIEPELKELLDSEIWGIYSCVSPADRPTYVIRFQLHLLPDYVGDLFNDTNRFLSDWEATMVVDTKSILFPSTFYGEASLNGAFFSSPRYQSEGVRQASVSIAGGVTGDIAHQIVGDYVLVSNNVDCMVATSETLIQLVL